MMREMQLSSSNRSRSRERGSTHLKKQMEVSLDIPPDYYSMSPELSRNSSKKSSGVPIKSLIEEEFSIKEKKTRHPSPGVIARLMGLDSLPSQPNPNPNHQMKKPETLTQASSSHEKYIFTEDELPEFKDVFEITEARKAKKKLHKSPVYGRPGSPDMEFVRMKFTEAKRLSTDGSLRSSREFNDAIEALESKKDILLEFLNKPNSLFAKHLKDLTTSPPDSPPRGASQITILKPSKRGVNLEIPKFERERDSRYRKHVSNISNSRHSFEDDYVSLTFDKPIKSKNKGKSEKNKASNIVVLKPSLDKARNTVGVGVFPVFYPDNDEGLVGPTREKSSREIAREITKQMRYTISANSSTNTKPAPLFDPNPLFDSNNNSLYDEWNYYTSPILHPVESSVNKEARKRLSDRWRNTHKSDEVGPFVSQSNTLGEIISKEKLHNDRDSRAILDNSYNNNVNNMSNYRNLTRSKSLPPKLGHKSSYHRRRGSRVSEFGLIKDVLDVGPKGLNVISHAQKAEKSEKLYETQTEGSLMEREIHVNSEELKRDDAIINEEKIEEAGPIIADLNCGNSFIAESIPFEEKPIEHDDEVAELVLNHDDVADRQVEEVMESQVAVKEGEEHPSPNSVMEPPFEEVEEEEEASTSECFEKISADLHELRMQLKLLKMGSIETLTEEEEQNNVFLLSDEEENQNNSLQSGERIDSQHFRNEEERDFSYLLDMLLNLGFHISNRDDLIHSCHSLDSPVGPTVFAKLERKYGDLVLWSRPERKILFDMINSVLAEIIGTWADLKKRIWAFGPNWNREEFVECVWEEVVKKRREIEFGNDEIFLEPKWSKEGLLKNGVDLVGSEIESFLHDVLLSELVSELISCY